jgi:hypothetical protein
MTTSSVEIGVGIYKEYFGTGIHPKPRETVKPESRLPAPRRLRHFATSEKRQKV